jgi:hypothetical protein
MFDELMINSNELHVKNKKIPNVVNLKIRLPWYRSLPVSCIERLEFTLDGKVIPADRTRLCVGGVMYSPFAIADLYESNWFVLDAKEVKLTLDSPISVGEHEVSLLMGVRIPYLEGDSITFGGVEFNRFVQYASCNKKMQYKGEIE